MLAVSAITFALTNVAADPARTLAGEGATSADVEAIRIAYGFDRPVIVRYGEWLGKALQAELGDSYRQKRPVTTVIFERLPVTLTLGGLAFGLAVPAAVPLGIAAGLRPNSWIDRLALGIAIVGQAMPSFWFALIGIVVFGVTLRWPPVSGSSTWAHFVLPAVVLAYYATPTLMRLTRAGIPNYKRTNVVMSVSGEPGAAYESYLRATDALFDSAGGRPHWGKLHFMTPDRLRRLFPRYDDFVSLRRELDPSGVFLNPHLEALFA